VPNLETEPPGTLADLDELFAMADAMERRAAEAYAAFAAMMRDQDRQDLAAVFESIAEEERGHVRGVAEWSAAQTGHPPDPGRRPWPARPTFEPEDEAAIGGSAVLTPYKALSIAVRNEERAFLLWSYLTANAGRPEVRQAAERMAREELGHVAIFRRERRKAFHRERAETGALVGADEAETRLAAMLRAAPMPDATNGIALLALAELSDGSARLAGGAPVQVCLTPKTTPGQLAELLADAYLAAAEGSLDEETMRRLQDLAGRAVQRLANMRRAGV
jgi:rubrerythrin